MTYRQNIFTIYPQNIHDFVELQRYEPNSLFGNISQFFFSLVMFSAITHINARLIHKVFDL